jgi:hypothetical protein
MFFRAAFQPHGERERWRVSLGVGATGMFLKIEIRTQRLATKFQT